MSAFILVGLIVAASYAPSMQLSYELDVALTQVQDPNHLLEVASF